VNSRVAGLSRQPEFGEAFETYIMHELMSYRDYSSGEPSPTGELHQVLK